MVAALLLGVSCGQQKNEEKMGTISEKTLLSTIEQLKNSTPESDISLIERGVRHAGSFWEESDGSESEFQAFCIENFAKTADEKAVLFEKIQHNLEILYGNYNVISLQLKEPLHLAGDIPADIDERFGALDPYAHLSDDMFQSKIAFSILLNFPAYSLEEKNRLGKDWSRQQWAYARLGDMFDSRVPASVNQRIATDATISENYISNYNIVMGNLRNESNQQLFPDGMLLISHWGLRDELKSNYANADGNGLEKQRMIYGVMKHIVNQTIPQQVINNDEYVWYPISNKVFKNEQPCEATAEANTRYEMLLNNCRSLMAADAYCPTHSTYLQRAFNQAMEVSDDEIERMFTQFIASDEVKCVAQLIEQRLGRKLEPFDIWYDGFKSRSMLNEEDLSKKTRACYPDTKTFEATLPLLLEKIGFSSDTAQNICKKITVDASRGAGHAWGAQMRSDKAHLRTRIAADGMDYKGYNIAVHEFGHNVEQTISLNYVDNYIMNGVPSTAFTEALAFVFQVRDLELLGISSENNAQKDALQTLDIFWGCYEIMGVSLVDLYTWRWLYEHPDASVEELKNCVLNYAKQVWNNYYAPILGEKDSPILAIYSHMIEIPLYLPNYPYGHLVQFQLEEFFKGKNIGTELLRIYPAGRLTPNLWMQHAVGSDVSIRPMLEATKQAVKILAN